LGVASVTAVVQVTLQTESWDNWKPG